VDLTPAAIGPYVVPTVSLNQHLTAQNINMVTCGGQATIPMVAAVSDVVDVLYAEIVASIASKSAGPGTRANIDEFTETTRDAIVELGRAKNAKAIIVLNPAEPPLMMRDTVLCLIQSPDAAGRERIRSSVQSMVSRVQEYVPGYRMKHDVDFEDFAAEFNPTTLIDAGHGPLTQVSIFLEVEGAANYLPAYAGNLDIMTSAALKAGESLAESAVASKRNVLA
jgi:acetaldehyde dehydrogenase